MENFKTQLKSRIENVILPARKSVKELILSAMADTYTELGSVLDLALLEHPYEDLMFKSSVAGLSPQTILSVAENYGFVEDWLYNLPEGISAGLLLEFIGSEKLRMDALRVRHPKAYTKWSEEEDSMLKKMYDEGTSWEELSRVFGRAERSLKMRLQYLGYVLSADVWRSRGLS